ncbi:MAG: CRP-like cAMP-binding protein [Shewanella sp.]|jgi:CRP-like cAMP-binding protein
MNIDSKSDILDDPLRVFSNVLNRLGLDQSAIDDTLSLSQSVSVSSGDILLRQGESQISIYFVVSGILKACHYNDNGGDLSKEFYFAHELCFLYASWLTGDAADYQIEVVEDAQLLQVPLSLLSQPQWQTAKIALLSQQLIYKEQKEVFLLLNTPEQRYQFLIEHRPLWVQKLNNIQLASYIGITPVSLSRLKSRLSE